MKILILELEKERKEKNTEEWWSYKKKEIWAGSLPLSLSHFMWRIYTWAASYKYYKTTSTEVLGLLCNVLQSFYSN